MNAAKRKVTNLCHFAFACGERMSLAEALQECVDRDITEPRSRLCTYETPADVVAVLRSPGPPPTSIALDMFIVLREQFHGGWTLWLGTVEDSKLTPAQKAGFPGLAFEKKAERLFRLTVWSNSSKKRDPEAKDITDIPDGAEVSIARVTGL